MVKHIHLIVVISVLFIGLSATFFGLSEMPLNAMISLKWDLVRNSYLILLAVLAIEASARWFGLNRLSIGVAIAAFIAVVSNTIWPLLVCIIFLLSSYILGQYILKILRVDKNNIPSLSILFIGVGIYGSVVGLIAHFPVNYSGFYAATLLAPLIIGRKSVIEVVSSFRKLALVSAPHRVLDIVIVLVGLVHFSVALMPEVGHDALAMHLFIPNHLAYRHEWGFDVTTYVWAVMPMLGDWVFSIVYMLAGETSARMLNVGFIFAIAWFIRDLVVWAGGNALGARWAAVIFLTTPLTFAESSSLFVESIWASFIIAGAYSVFNIISKKDNLETHLPVAGMLLAFAIATKAVSFTILPVLLLLLIIRYRDWLKAEYLYSIMSGFFLLISIGIIPYVTAWYITDNPLFPFYNEIFKSPFYPKVNFISGFNEGITWDVIYQATFHSGKYMESRAGAVGFQWLVLFFPAILILLFAKRFRGLVLFVTASLAIILTFQSTAYLRYIFPSFIWASAGVGVAFSQLKSGSYYSSKVIHIILWLVVGLNLLFFQSATSYGNLSSKPIASSNGRTGYLDKRLPIRNAIKLVNEVNSSNLPVAVFSSPLTAGLNADALYPNWYNNQFNKLVNNAITSSDMVNILRTNDVAYVIVDKAWGTELKRKIILDVTTKVSEFGGISVRRLNDEFQFTSEMIKNTDFSSNDGWEFLVKKQAQTSGYIVVNVKSPAIQKIKVKAGMRYLNSIVASCEKGLAKGRLQVNWIDKNLSFISTDIQLYDCTESSKKYSMTITAPKYATFAVVYAVGHSDKLIRISEVSFRK